MNIIIKKLPDIITEEEKQYYISLLEDEKKEKVLRFPERKCTQSIFANMIAKTELSKILGKDISEVSFTYNEFGKPFLKNCDDLFFNISHSGEYIVVVTDNKPVGIDIEKIKPLNEHMISRVCSESERDFLKKSEDIDRDFTKLWTLKESMIKAKGRGITDGLKNYRFLVEDGNAVSLCGKADIVVREDIEGYIVSVCSIIEKPQKTKSELVRRSITKKFRKSIWNNFIGAVKDYALIEEGDRVAVCISGGKDSMLLAVCVNELIKHSQIPFEAKYIVMNPGYNKKNLDRILSNAKELGIDIHIFESPIFDYVAKQDGSPCYLCAKMRRGYLYKEAQSLGCNKIALGHHFDDVIETTLLNLFYASEIKTMMPKLRSTNYEGMELIRPLYMVKEEDIIHWAKYNELEFIRCACRFTEEYETSETEEGHKRAEVKKLIKHLRTTNPYVDMSIFKSMHNVNLATVVGYRESDGGEVCDFKQKYNKNKKI